MVCITASPERVEVPERITTSRSHDSLLIPPALGSAPLAYPRQLPVGARAPQGSPDRWMLGLYANTFSYLKTIASRTNHSRASTDLDHLQAATRNLSTAGYLVHAFRHREAISQISMDLGVWDDPSLQAVLEEDQAAVTRVLLQMLFSPSDERTVLALEEDAASL
ncbi:hypothetical protein B0H13DRAFT_161252 [Mycena leptocephala]|nr:hypothetical protein B0H13DRAFT_161252 [Mycena leptocephala]